MPYYQSTQAYSADSCRLSRDLSGYDSHKVPATYYEDVKLRPNDEVIENSIINADSCDATVYLRCLEGVLSTKFSKVCIEVSKGQELWLDWGEQGRGKTEIGGNSRIEGPGPKGDITWGRDEDGAGQLVRWPRTPQSQLEKSNSDAASNTQGDESNSGMGSQEAVTEGTDDQTV